jgi:hypothetical protein
MRAGKLFTLASGEIDIGGVLIEDSWYPGDADRDRRAAGGTSRHSAMLPANHAAAVKLPDEIYGPIGDAVLVALIDHRIAKRRFAAPGPA